MTRASIPRLASEVSVSLKGAGSFLPERRVSNEEILDYLRPLRPDGRPLEPAWVVKHLGIHERRLDYEFGGRHKRSRADDGLFDGDLALRAGRAALVDAGIDATEVDLLVHVSTTPDLLACQDHFRFLVPELGLRRDVDLVHHNLGCAGVGGRVPHDGVLACLPGPRHRPRGGEQLPVGLLRARGARLLLQARERHGVAGAAHVRRRRRCGGLALGTS